MHRVLHVVAKSLIGWRKIATPVDKLPNSTKDAIDILNNTEGVEVAHLFCIRETEVLKKETKCMLWLKDARGSKTVMFDQTS